jgi:hypothetical protein
MSAQGRGTLLAGSLLATIALGCTPRAPSASLAALLSGGADGAQCYESAAGRVDFGSDASSRPGPTWLVVARTSTTSRSGSAFVTDTIGPPDLAQWQQAGDSLVVRWFDGFATWEATLSLTSSSATGMARWSGDEVHDSSGVWVPVGGRYAVWARAVPCATVQQPQTGAT